MKISPKHLWSTGLARARSSEGGFTLAELLVAIVITSTIVLALAAAFIVSAKTSAEADTRLRESHDAQLLATYFGADVGSADSISASGVPGGACGSGLPGTTVALLQWTDGTTDKKAFYVQPAAEATQLVRRYCVGGAVVSQITMVKNLASATLSCRPSTDCIEPYRVELEIVETSGYTYTLRALPRSTGAAQILAAPPRVVSVKRKTPASELTNASSVTWVVAFSEPVRNVTSSDFVLVNDLNGTAPTISGIVPNVASFLRDTWTVTAAISSGSNAGHIQLELRDTDNSIRDEDGNPLENPTMTGESYTIDRVAPTVTLTLAPGQAVSTNQLPIHFTATVSEPVAFASGQVTRTGTSTGGTITVNGTGPTYDIVVAGISTGTFTAQIAAGQVPDAAGNANNASATVSVAYDPALLVVRSIDRTDPSPTTAASGSVKWLVTFSEPVIVSTVSMSDDFQWTETMTGNLSNGSWTVAQGTSGLNSATFIVTANTSGLSGDGTLRLDLKDNDSIRTPAPGNKHLGGSGSNNGDFTGQAYAIDKDPPTVTMALAAGQGASTNQLPIRFTATFNGPVIGFDGTDVTTTGGTVTVTGAGPAYNIAVAGAPGGSTVTVSIAANRATDAIGNGNLASNPASVYYDPALLRVVSIDRLDPDPTDATSERWLVTFSQAVVNSTVSVPDDLQWAETMGGSLSNSNWTVTPGGTTNSTTFTVAANTGSLSGSGTLRLDLKDNNTVVTPSPPTAKPLGGPGVGNGDFTGQSYTIDRSPPAITSVELKNKAGGIAGKLEQGDQMIVTFSRRMKVSSFCNGWSGDTTDQFLTGDDQVRLQAHERSGNDRMQLTTSNGTCTFRLGTIDLGDDGYVDSDVDFRGSGADKSTINWDATNFRLTLLLGKPGSATNVNAGSHRPVYSSDGAIQSQFGDGISNSPFTLPNGPQF